MLSAEDKLKTLNWLKQRKRGNAIQYVRDRYSMSTEEAVQKVQEVESEYLPAKFFNADPAYVVGRVFSGSGLVFLVVVLVLLWKDQTAARNTSIVMGTVTSLDINSSGSAAPVISYRVYGSQRTLHGDIWSSPPAFDVGEQVELLVSNAPPGNVIINSFFERYFVIFLFGIFTVAFGGAGLLVQTFVKK